MERIRSRPGVPYRGFGVGGAGGASNLYFTNDAKTDQYFVNDAKTDKYKTNGGINTPFSPLDIGPLFYAYAPDQSASGMTQSGGAVSAWINKGSAGTTFNAVAPSLNNDPTTGIKHYKGKNLLSFDGVDDYLTLGSSTIGSVDLFADVGKAWTVYVSGVIDDTGYLIAKINGTNVNFRVLAIGALVNGQIVGICRGTNTTLKNTYTPGDVVCVIARWDGTNLTYWYNGSRITGNVGAGGAQSTNIQFGARSGGANFPLVGGIGEAAIYDTALSDAQVAQINEYAQYNWINPPIDARFFAVGASNEVRTFIDLSGAQRMIDIIGNQYHKNIIMDVFASNGEISSGCAANIGAKLASMPDKATEDFPTYAWVHIAGNDVTNTRPYSSTSGAQRTALSADNQSILNQLSTKGYIPILTDISFRHYGFTVLPGPTEVNGSLPYNTNIIRPIVPAGWRFPDGIPYIQLYTLMINNYTTYLDPDGIHFSLSSGRAAYRQHIADTVGRMAFLGLPPVEIF